MANPSAQSSHPLTDEHYHTLSSCLQGCNLLDELLAKAQSAGLNVDQHVRANNQRKSLANGLKQAFFPDRP
jgi:hypothetical protein